MTNEVVFVEDPSGELSIGIEQITLDTENYPEVNDDEDLFTQSTGGILSSSVRAQVSAVTYAKQILDSGRNVIVQPANEWFRNTCYVDYWNRYAQGLNLWVKFIDDVDPDDEGIRTSKTIVVM